MHTFVQIDAMKIEDICEPIEVIALFRSGAVHPLKFRWKDHVYKVLRLNGGWSTEEGSTRFHHFAVMSDGPDVFELAYNERDHHWTIERISLIG